VCLCFRLAKASWSEVCLPGGRYRITGFCRRAFTILVITRPSGACKRISLSVVVCWNISYAQFGLESRSGLMDFVVKVVCSGCHPPVCELGAADVDMTFLQVGALLAWEVFIGVFPLGVVSNVVLATPAGFQFN